MTTSKILTLSRLFLLGPTVRSLSVVIICFMLTTEAAGPCLLAQQASFNRVIHVTATDPLNRFVTGLEQAHFDITENGVHRTIAHFSNVDSPIAIAIVGMVAPRDVVALKGSEDELFQAQSIPDALRVLATATSSRKALISNVASDEQNVPDNIQVLKADEGSLFKAVIEVRNCYSLGFSSSDRSSIIEVMLKQPRGLPPLRLINK